MLSARTLITREYALHARFRIIGGGAPIVVQSMTDTNTADAKKTIEQIKLLADAGSEIVRITVNNEAAASQVALNAMN